jgi:predicted nucleic acid-binding protein
MAWLGAARGTLVCWWPTLLYLEVANALLRAQRSQRLSPPAARALLGAVRRIPARSVAVERLVEEALALATSRGLSVYDACYAALAETVDAPLVTADRRLAAATPNAVLIGD